MNDRMPTYSSQDLSTRLALWAAALSFVVRLAVVFVLGTWHVPADGDHWAFGYEMGRIARSIAEGRGYISPFGTGEPTAWMPPLYPYLLSGVFSIFGVYSPASAIVILVIQCAIGAATVFILYALACRWAGRRAAVIAAFGFAIYPPAVYFSGGIVSSSPLSVLLTAMTLLLAQVYRETARIGTVLSAGLVASLTALLDPVSLVLLPCILYAILRAPTSLATRLRVSLIAVIVAVVVLTPWTVRNYIVFGTWVPIKSNLGQELAGSLNDHVARRKCGESGPSVFETMSPSEKELTAGMDEVVLNQWLLKRALHWARAHPRRVLELSLCRAAQFWWQTDFGAALEQAMRHGGPLAKTALALSYPAILVLAVGGLILAYWQGRPVGSAALFFLLYPLIYYVRLITLYRYRYPLEPFLLIFAALAMASLSRYPRVDTPGSSYPNE
ncbi:glycosyltransferase family 39 protein [Candidatus Methylomirabilis sp.]|uniref:ArnT family glycosyltransferase n=1 Tax=Candidatus Methylomirabilis sp. TaxID=2032687 RepID=UPI003076545E